MLLYMSFSDDGENLGVTVVEARSVPEAVMKTKTLRINPGGDIIIVEITDDVLMECSDKFRENLNKLTNRLVLRDEWTAMGLKSLETSEANGEFVAIDYPRKSI